MSELNLYFAKCGVKNICMLTPFQSEDEEEIEDMTINPTDLILLTARNEDDVSHLEVCQCNQIL